MRVVGITTKQAVAVFGTVKGLSEAVCGVTRRTEIKTLPNGSKVLTFVNRRKRQREFFIKAKTTAAIEETLRQIAASLNTRRAQFTTD